MKDLAIQKLDKELKELTKTTKHITVMKQPVHDALVDFCREVNEFAQAVYQGGTFAKCMEAVAKDCGNALSDLEAYRRAVQFYFPGADIRVQMRVSLCPDAEPEDAPVPTKREEPVILDLLDALGV
jgi:hypothetical protein